MLERRRFLCLLGAVAATLAAGSRRAGASVARALSLSALVLGSERAMIGTTLVAESRFDRVGGRRRIITFSRIRVDDALGGPVDAGELLVRTLGGKVGDVGQVVHGEAMLLLGEPALLFLSPTPEGPLAVAAMAQGHYPIRKDKAGQLRVFASPRVAELLGEGAARDLVGKRVSEAAEVVRKAWRDAR